MTKPQLEKVRALFYVLQQFTEIEAAPILTQPLVLTYRLYCPRDTALYELPGGIGLSDNLVVGGADALKAVVCSGSYISFCHRFSLHCGRL